VTVFVGESNTKPFKIHLEAIIHYSPYFKAAFTNPDHVESQTKAMQLPTVDEKVFGLFNNWLYTQDIDHGDGSELQLMELAKLWTAAKTWKVPSLQNKALFKMTKLLITEPGSPSQEKDAALRQFLNHAYATDEETALKKMAVHAMFQVLPSVVLPKEWVADFPNGMLADFAEALMAHHQTLDGKDKIPRFDIRQMLGKETEL
jgi:BTB/POZ domain